GGGEKGGGGGGGGGGGRGGGGRGGRGLRPEGPGRGRAPPAGVGDARHFGDAAGLLRRNDVGDLRLMAAEVGDERACRRIHRGDGAPFGQRHPLEEPGVQLRPGGLEQLLLGKGVLRVEDDQFRAGLLRLEKVG